MAPGDQWVQDRARAEKTAAICQQSCCRSQGAGDSGVKGSPVPPEAAPLAEGAVWVLMEAAFEGLG